MLQLPELRQVLAYQHPQVIKSYQRDYPRNAHKGDELFHEMLKFLWLSWKHTLDRDARPADESIDFVFVMHEEMRDIDNMWHTFLLYTKDYTAFCVKYFGEYLHHEPDIANKTQQPLEEFEADLEKFLSYVYDNLGEETVRGWFAMHLQDEALTA